MNGSHLDLSLLENVRHRGDDVISACPACREAGKDRNRDNLRIFASQAFHCIAYPKEREHNGRIFALVGVRGEVTADPVAKRDFRERRARDLQKKGIGTASSPRDSRSLGLEGCRRLGGQPPANR